MSQKEIDYLILGSGLSALNVGALLAKANYKVVILEAHDLPGGYGHTFIEKHRDKEYHFNAQLHYVWDCGKDQPVYQVLKKLGLEEDVKFSQYDPDGFDHMYMPGHHLKIPGDYEKLTERLCEIDPKASSQIKAFIEHLLKLTAILKKRRLSGTQSFIESTYTHFQSLELLKNYGKTLQEVFDQWELPKEIQTLLASQWPDFLLPPDQLDFYCWLVLFDGYMNGAYYPQKHFEHVVNSLVKVIKDHGGEVLLNTTVIDIKHAHQSIKEVIARDTNDPTVQTSYTAKGYICNMDPKHTAQMMGLENFSSSVRKKLDYEYSYSNYMVYGAVKDIDLRDYGFGKWNIFHTESKCLNQSFHEMYNHANYKNISFALTSPSLIVDDQTGCPEGEQLFEFLTVANYNWFKQLKYRNNRQYVLEKKAVYDRMIEIIERDYVPNFSKHVSLKVMGSPTTNESYCLSPQGNSYGANMTPKNMTIFKLNHETSFDNFYFCNASSGFAGFAKSFTNGADLYQVLTKDQVYY